jgi:hypothetical protein
MKKLIEIKKQVEEFEKGLRELKLEQTKKQGDLKKLQEDKKNYILENFGEHRDQNQIKAFDIQIENLEKEIKSLDEQIVLLELEKKSKFAPKMDDLKKERQELVDKGNARIKELEEKLFIIKFETLLELENACREREELQEEIEEFEIIGKFTSDRVPELKKFVIDNKDYLIHGGMEAPVCVQQGELHKLTSMYGGFGSPYRLPFAYLVYKMTQGKELIIDEKIAQDRYLELQRGAK